ncbi:hypothetical protein TcWFU_001976 [Taenia crassiceps]|uniref:Uncharacterized protein n=1 Tax=Taenia crassiceps TaxID=6207 RepID=A0ABR4QFQ6_9CEST
MQDCLSPSISPLSEPHNPPLTTVALLTASPVFANHQVEQASTLPPLTTNFPSNTPRFQQHTRFLATSRKSSACFFVSSSPSLGPCLSPSSHTNATTDNNTNTNTTTPGRWGHSYNIFYHSAAECCSSSSRKARAKKRYLEQSEGFTINAFEGVIMDGDA